MFGGLIRHVSALLLRQRPSISFVCRWSRVLGRLIPVAPLSVFSVSVFSAELPGRISGEFNVTPKGAAAYVIPIEVPEGINGIRPSVKFVYSSQSRDGLAGIGWTVTGFSRISRCPLTIAVDGRVKGVDYGIEDRYCLDGSPLILVNGQYGDANAEYRTELHDYQKVESFGSLGNGPEYFTVTLRDGTVRTYGSVANSRRAPANAGGEVNVWSIDSEADTYGNKIGYRYVQDSLTGEFYPDRVSWTYPSGSSADSAPYQLEIEYEDRPVSDQRSGYQAGTLWTTSKRIDRIVYKFQGSRVHEYELSYEVGPSDGRSFLNNITLCGTSDSICLPPTEFTWEHGQSGFRAAQSASIDMNPHFLADYDGDNYLDLWGWGQTPDETVVQRWNHQTEAFDPPVILSGEDLFVGTIYQNDAESVATPIEADGDLATELLIHQDIYDANDLVTPIFTLPTGGLVGQGYVIDANGDGYSDVLVNRGYFGGGVRYYTGPILDLYLNNADGSGFTLSAASVIIIPGDDFYSSSIYAGLDFNGDGLGDIAVQYKETGELIDPWPGNPNSLPYPDDGYYLAFYVAEASDSGVTFVPYGPSRIPSTDYTMHNSGPSSAAKFGDFNGDGLTDVAYEFTSRARVFGVEIAPSFSKTLMYLSDGNGFLPGKQASDVDDSPLMLGALHFTGSGFLRGGAIVTDYDGDGLDDLVKRCDNAPYGSKFCIHFSDGERWVLAPLRIDELTSRKLFDSIPGDIDKDGRADFVATADGEDYTNYGGTIRLREAQNVALVSRIEDGLGNYFEPEYELAAGGDRYTTPGGGLSSNTYGIAAMRLVSGYTANTGVSGQEYTVSFEYKEPKQSLDGRGFLGFKDVLSTDSRSQTIDESRYRQDFPYTGWKVYSRMCLAGAGDCDPATENLISLTTYSQSVDTVSGASSTNHVAGQYHFVYESNQNNIRYEVDSFASLGQPVSELNTAFLNWDFSHGVAKTVEETATGYGPSSPQDRKMTSTVVSFDESVRASRWCLGQATRIEKTGYIGATPGDTRVTTYQYTPECNEDLRTENATALPDFQLMVDSGYDSVGRLNYLSSVDGAYSQPARVTTMLYDTLGFRVSETRSQIAGETDHVTGAAWHNALGLPASNTTPGGQTTSWLYDDFGRQTNETRPLGSSTTLIDDCATGCSSWVDAEYKVTITGSNGSSKTTFFDPYERPVGDQVLLIDGSASKKEISYNSEGRIAQQTNRYVAAAGRHVTSFTYDVTGRKKTETRENNDRDTSSITASWDYDRLTTTVTDFEQNVTIETVDSSGNLVGVTDALNNLSEYTYTEWNELKTVKDPGDTVVTNHYDIRGLLVGVDDPDMGGLWEYAYNAFGEQTHIRDAKTASPNWTTAMSYDQLGRMYSRVDVPEGDVTTWEYYDAGSGKGLLERVISPTDLSSTGYEKTITYTAEGLVSVETTSVDGMGPYMTGNSYDAHGQLELVSSAAFGIPADIFEYTYSYGFQKTLSKYLGYNLEGVYEVVSQDPYGRPNQEIFGPGSPVTVTKTFDSRNSLLNSISSSGGGLSIQEYEYHWDKVGNLKERQNNLPGAGYIEEFFYDDLYRLERVDLDAVPTSTLTYYADGNIKSKTDMGRFDLGTYVYGDPNMPHAVTQTAQTCEGQSAGCCSNLRTYGYDDNGNVISIQKYLGASGTIKKGLVHWSSFNKPIEINEATSATTLATPADNCSHDCSRLVYGPDRQLIKQYQKSGSKESTIYYVSPYLEVEVSLAKTDYRASAIANGKAVMIEAENTNPGEFQSYLVLRDHLGSVDTLVPWVGPATANVVHSFDAFGDRRNADWTPDSNNALDDPDLFNHQGYTGHEQLNSVGIVYMKGRVYDPELGRMLSADPVQGDIRLPQSINSFSYVYNNPLRYIDPFGFSGGEAGLPIDEAITNARSASARKAKDFKKQKQRHNRMNRGPNKSIDMTGKYTDPVNAGAVDVAEADQSANGNGWESNAAGDDPVKDKKGGNASGSDESLGLETEENRIVLASNSSEGGNDKSKNDGKKYKKPDNPNKRKGAEKRQPGGHRERNVGHSKGEEHSRRPKGGSKIPRGPKSVIECFVCELLRENDKLKRIEPPPEA